MDEFSTSKLLDILTELQHEISNGKIPVDIQQDIWRYLHWTPADPNNKDLVKFLFTGWWVNSQTGTACKTSEQN